MVNSKKMSKSTVAIVLLSLLLVLSLILTATGAWFTSSDNKAGNADVAFGKVEVKLDGEATLTKCSEAALVTDNCEWNMTKLEMKNTSSVDIYYAYDVTVELQKKNGENYEAVTDETVKGYFTITGTKVGEAKLATAGAPLDALEDIKVVFNSKNAMNGNTDEYRIAVTVNVRAIQAAHIDGADADAKLATAKTMLADLANVNK